MKGFTRVCLILAGIFACIGVVLAIVGVSMGASLNQNRSWGGNLPNTVLGWISEDENNTENGEEQIYRYTGEELAGIRNLDVELKAGSLKMMESEEEELRLAVKAKENQVTCKLTDGTLVIEDTKSHVWFGITSDWINSGGVEVELYLPKSMEWKEIDIEVNAGEIEAAEIGLKTERAELNVDAGTLKLDGLIVTEHLAAEVGAGEVQLSNLDANTLDLECGMGEMNIDGKASGDIVADCGMGELNLTIEDQMESFNYRISCGMGDVKMGNKSYTSFGKKNALDNQADKTMKLDCGMGEININYK